MRSRLGVVCILAVFAAGVAAAAIRADPPVVSTTTTTDSVSTATTDTTPATTSAETTAPTTTTAATTTAATTTTPRRATGRAVTPIARSIDGACLLVGAVMLHRPGQPLQVLGPIVQSRGARALAASGIAYPADGSVVDSSVIELSTTGCRSANGSVAVRSLSLFGGVIRAARVELGLHRRKPDASSTISGLEIGGKPIRIAPGRPIALADWGYVLALPSRPISFGKRGRANGGLFVRLLRPHAGLPAGTTLLVTFAGLPLRQLRLLDRPLKVTPPLGLPHYVFPVAGRSDFVDTYGAFRSDTQGNWHHGDDIFATLGTPVVAVADGTLNRAGWEKVGGWRLWVRDRLGNEFYYAHLSGYSPQALHSKRVRAGEVLGFIGNTGDAFTTSPHLHFEIHPRPLLHLEYGGAVDPTSYLLRWQHVARVHVPLPVHPRFPVGAVRTQASVVWRELLVARGLIRPPRHLLKRPPVPVLRETHMTIAAQLEASSPRPRNGSNALLLAFLLATTAPIGLGSVLLARRLRH